MFQWGYAFHRREAQLLCGLAVPSGFRRLKRPRCRGVIQRGQAANHVGLEENSSLDRAPQGFKRLLAGLRMAPQPRFKTCV